MWGSYPKCASDGSVGTPYTAPSIARLPRNTEARSRTHADAQGAPQRATRYPLRCASWTSIQFFERTYFVLGSLLDKEVESILSSCPRLRLLNLRYCKLPCKVLVNALELRTLKIFRCEQVNEIGFFAPNLDCFSYFGKTRYPFLVHMFLIWESCVSVWSLTTDHHMVLVFVGSAPCLHTLCIQATPYQVQCIRSEMPTVWNVHRLSLHVIKESLDLRDIISLIPLCPNLTRFDLSSHLCCLKYTERDEEVPLTCVHLKLVVLDGFKFYAAQKKFASHLIRCAPALVEMNIFYPLL
ncbi:hypothetical protein LIER_13147 [Lithospermum erythrorhizon]|uniref:At1g61320/AtMIF1 LRR domain-containing protein n=1 Tax=Lithospermum erythrorhizon TaxID=34254 RepID=A0AAV3PZN4_LITER